MTTTSTIIQAFDALLYADAFDCALTMDEIHRYSRLKTDQTQLGSLINSEPLSSFITQHSDYFFLYDHIDNASNRIDSIARAEKLCRRACRIAKWVHILPFVRGIVLTGSVAANDAKPTADIDFLLIVAKSRLSFVFLVLGTLSTITRRSLFCPNYYLSDNQLSVLRRDFYVAREIAQAIPLIGNAVDFLDSNDWIESYLPNIHKKANCSRPIAGTEFFKKIIELICNCFLSKRITKKLDSLVLSRLSKHYERQSLVVPEQVKAGFVEGRDLRFHNPKRVNHALNRYKENRENLFKHLASNISIETKFPHSSQGTKPTN